MIQKKQLYFQRRKVHTDATTVDYQDLAGNTVYKSGNTYSQKNLFGIAQQNIWLKKTKTTKKPQKVLGSTPMRQSAGLA